MALAVLYLTLLGPLLAGSHLSDRPLGGLLGLLVLWLALEFYIGLRCPFAGHVPQHWIVHSSRLLWLAAATYSWWDVRSGWTLLELPPAVSWTLLSLAVGGLTLRSWAVFYLGNSFTYDVHRPAEGRVVTTGIYRWIRHPSYLGMCLLGTLPGFVLGSLPGGIGLALATLPQTIYRLQFEERMLEQEFGAAFREYQRTSYRLVPFVY